METLNIYIGYDQKEVVAWHVLAQSILEKSSQPVALIPLNLKNLKNYYQREFDARQSNEFSFSSFLVPHLQQFRGFAVYMDCDMLIRGDIVELFNLAKKDPKRAVHVVQHDYQPKDNFKYLGNKQYSYPRKNWSSLVVWNCSHPANSIVNANFVESSSAAHLHRFNWLKDEEIGNLPIEWNWLVGEYDLNNSQIEVSLVHWTVGGPYFHEYSGSDFADEWFKTRDKINYCDQVK